MKGGTRVLYITPETESAMLEQELDVVLPVPEAGTAYVVEKRFKIGGRRTLTAIEVRAVKLHNDGKVQEMGAERAG